MTKQEDKQFEFLILKVACIIGTVRMVIAIYNDFTVNAHNELFVSDLIVDSVILIVFLIPLILSRFSVPFDYIVLPFCFVLTLLVSVNWFLTGGLKSTAEYHMLVVFILYGLLLSGKWMIFFILLMLVDQIVLIYLWENPTGGISDLKTIPPDDAIHFISMAVGATIGLLFFKNRFEAKGIELRDDKKELSNKYVELEAQNRQLKEYEQELEQMNSWLERKVQGRVEELQIQKHAINEYMHLSLKEVKKPLKSTLESLDLIQKANNQNQLVDLLTKSGQELNETIEMIAEKLRRDNLSIDES